MNDQPVTECQGERHDLIEEKVSYRGVRGAERCEAAERPLVQSDQKIGDPVKSQ